MSISCPYIDGRRGIVCSDIISLRQSHAGGRVDEDLADQYHHLCTACGHGECSLYQSYESREELVQIGGSR